MPISRETQPAEGATPSEGASSARARTPAFAVTDRRSRRAAVRLSELQSFNGRLPPSQAACKSRVRESFIVFIHTLFASLTGLPALLTGAAPVSRVCQVFG